MLRISDLHKRFGGVVVADGISFDLQAGEAIGLRGPNGAGKTTLLDLITGFVRPQGGEIVFAGRSLLDLPAHAIVRLGVARTFQLSRPFPSFTVRQHCLLAAGASRVPAAAIDAILDRLGLRERSEFPATALSQGWLRRLEVARALACHPSLLLLDEPFSGLSVKDEDEVLKVLAEARSRGIGLLVVAHNMRLLSALVDRTYTLRNGRLEPSRR